MWGSAGSLIRVLHVDDDPEFADLTATMLEDNGQFAVETATSASAGLERLDADVDCIVSDYEMPGTDGIEFLETVRERRPDLPFILFTGRGSESIASEAISAGVTDYLQKRPGTEQYELLANRITNAVDQARAGRRAEKQRRISTVVREVNQALVHATSREEIDHRVCEILSDADPYLFAWIGTVDDANDRLEPRAAAGTDDGYLDDVTVTVDDSPTGQGPGGTAVRENRIAVSQDVSQDDSFARWREQALERGYRAVAAIPLIYEDTRYAVLSVYADRPDAFDASERSLLSELGETIAHAYQQLEIQQEYEDQYRELFEEAPVMFTFTRAVDGEPIIEDCNRLFAETLGYDREELRGTRLASVYTEESARALLDGGGYDRALSGEFVREQREFVTSDGEIVTTLLRATPRRNTDGEIVGTHALFVDITDQSRLERLERLRERMDMALEATDSILYEIDLETDEQTRHGPFERLYGFESERAPTTETFHETGIHPEDQHRVEGLKRRERIREEGGSVEVEYRTHPDNGPVRWIRSEAYGVTDDTGDLTRLIGLATDVTGRRERERELRRQNERLDEFASVVSHDLRSPLTTAEGQLALARENHDSDHLDAVARAHDRMGELIDDLLALARQGDRVNEMESVSVADLCRNCWQTVETGAATLSVEIDRTIRADPGRLQQVFENLIRNALEHGSTNPRSKAPDESVQIRIGPLDDGEGFYVADDGPGIPPEERDRVFESGYSTDGDGNGFGLSIVRGIVEAHGWEISVTDGAEGGARFEITGVDTVD
ncbi:MAG: ATP-binding protein [Salinirussus sp.]